MSYPQVQPPQSNGAVPVLFSNNGPGTSGSTSFVCLGLAATITPLASGRVRVDISTVVNNNTIGDGTSAQIIYGTGAAPGNGNAVPGSAITVGLVKGDVSATAAGQYGQSFTGIVTGLVLGTTYWFDLQFKAVTGGTASITNCDTVLQEV